MKVEYFPTKNWYISKRNMELFEDRVQPCLREDVSIHHTNLKYSGKSPKI